MTKRGLYARFLKDQIGIVQVLDVQSKVIGVRPADDSEPNYEIPSLYPSWRSFNRHWECHYPKLVIARPREDVCDDCWRYANSFRFKKRGDGQQTAGQEDDSSDDDEEQKNNEGVVEKAAVHVEMAKIQRELFNRKTKEAKETRSLPRSERTATWVLDFAQNMSLPHHSFPPHP